LSYAIYAEMKGIGPEDEEYEEYLDLE